ncbi:MAG: hypothetical protein U0822_24155 [Anaerolineae bacterium]
MANTNVYTGSDATLTLAVEAGAEGDAAKEIIEFYGLSPVGRATNVEVVVTTSVQAFHEVGRRHPASLSEGNIDVSGKIGRAFINGALLRLMLGQGALVERSSNPFPQPSFNLQLLARNPALPDTNSTLTIHGVKFDSWVFNLPEDDFLMEGVTFKGLFITVEDKEATGG